MHFFAASCCILLHFTCKSHANMSAILSFMVTVKFYLDTRSVKTDGTSPLKIAIIKSGKTALVNLGIALLSSQWDKNREKIISHPLERQLNLIVAQKKLDLESFILNLESSDNIAAMSAQDIKNLFTGRNLPPKEVKKKSIEDWFIKFAGQKSGTTAKIYLHTLSRMKAFCPKLSAVTLDEIDKSWLTEFDSYLALTAPSKNARNVHLRNIRAVFNAAIDAGDTANYPFRRFKIRPVPTRKRSLSVEKLRELFDYPVEEYAIIYRDMFKLIFLLMGINSVDLHRLGSPTSDGRLEYTRAKTHRLYSIKIEPEAMALIEKYRGKNGLLCIADRWTDHRNFGHQMNKALQRIGAKRSGLGGKKSDKGAFPELSTYWARHSWATVAASLDIPKETIAAALGHGGNTVTDIYIDFDMRKVDEANRKVIDWVLYGKR